MAPGAKIYLVETASNSFADLLTAVNVASNLVTKAGGGEVSMSWGGSELGFPGLLNTSTR
jgi:kumamolisin